MELQRVISGGQTGVDQAALRAALRCGLEVGGWCPPGRVCEGGTIPDEFPLVETPRECSERAPGVPRSLRTEWNVRDSDATLILRPAGASLDPGMRWTAEAADLYRKKVFLVDTDGADVARSIAALLSCYGVCVLNVAGPSEGSCPGIGERVEVLLSAVLRGDCC